MVIEYFLDPVPHLIIDHVLGVQKNTELLNQIDCVAHRFAAGGVINFGQHVIDQGFRKNLTIWLDTFDNDTLPIMTTMSSLFFEKQIVAAVTQAQDLDHIQGSQSRSHNMVISRYHDSDFYKWHIDVGGHVTWNYFCYQEPRQFVGGDFVLSNAEYTDTVVHEKIISCVNDRLVVFPAKYQHCVTKMHAAEVAGRHCRHSIQVFFS